MDTQKLMNSSVKQTKASRQATPNNNNLIRNVKKDQRSGLKTNNTTQEVVMSKVTFAVEKMFVLPDAGNLKAFADISVNEAIVIRGVRVMEGKKGTFVSMPREQGKDNKWYDQVLCLDTETFEAMTKTVIAHYELQAAACV